MLQVDRIAKARGFDSSHKQQLVDLINRQTENPQFSLLGEHRINVLILNIELDNLDQNISNNK
jgi:K+-transporting ATPase c subunit